MKARTIGVNATIPAVVGVEVAVIAAIVVFPPARMSWWPTVAVAVIAVAALLVTVYRRNMIRWLVDRTRWWRRRRRNDPPAAAIDIPHGASLYGVRVVGQVRRRSDHDDRGDRPGLLADAADRLGHRADTQPVAARLR